MLTGYRAWKMINESFGNHFTLGIKSPKALGMVGSKLAEMGLDHPHKHEDDLDPDLAALLGKDNQDPDHDGDDDSTPEGDTDHNFFPPEDEDDHDDSDHDDSDHDDSDHDGLETPELADAEELDGNDFSGGDDDDDHGDHDDFDDLHAMLGHGEDHPDERGSDGLPPGFFDDEGEEDSDDKDSDDLDDEVEPEEDEDSDEEDDEEEPEEDEEEHHPLKKKSKKYCQMDGDGDEDEEMPHDHEHDHDDEDETVYSKKFMKKGAHKKSAHKKDDNFDDLTNKWMKEKGNFFDSLVNMGRGEVHKKFSSGLSKKNEGELMTPKARTEVPAPGEPGFAPQGRIGSLSTFAAYSESNKSKGAKAH